MRHLYGHAQKEVRKDQVEDLSLKYRIQTSDEIGLVATDQKGRWSKRMQRADFEQTVKRHM